MPDNTNTELLPSGNSRCPCSSRDAYSAVARQSGVGLLEVLIALVILSFGFLATARMQLEGMHYSQGAYNLSQAKFMVLDMTERMRVNREGMQGDVYKTKTTAAGTTNPGCVSDDTTCSPADMATADLHAWSQNLHAPSGSTSFTPLLPSSTSIPAKGLITYNATEGAYSVTVEWSETIDGTDEKQSLSVKVFP